MFHRGPYKTIADVEYATAGWVDWYNASRLHGTLGNVPPTARPPFAPGAAMPDVPVLVLSGDLDANTSSASGRQASAQFPNATFVEVKNAGHTPVQTPEGLQLVLNFFSGPRRDQRRRPAFPPSASTAADGIGGERR